MRKILNLTNTPATSEQKKLGLVDLTEEEMIRVEMLWSFKNFPSNQGSDSLRGRAEALVAIANAARVRDPEISHVLIGGPDYLLRYQEFALMSCAGIGFIVVYPFYATKFLSFLKPGDFPVEVLIGWIEAENWT